MISVKKLGFSSRSRAKVRCQEPLGVARAQPLPGIKQASSNSVRSYLNSERRLRGRLKREVTGTQNTQPQSHSTKLPNCVSINFESLV